MKANTVCRKRVLLAELHCAVAGLAAARFALRESWCNCCVPAAPLAVQVGQKSSQP